MRTPSETVFFFFFGFREAAAVWRWSNFLHQHSPPGRRIVRINMDETSIRLHQAVKNGHLTSSARAVKRSARSLTSSATTSQTRGMFTLVAFVCDDATIQQILPQVLLVNTKHLNAAEPAAALRTHLDANTVLWTCTKAWVTSALMCKIVALLHERLRPYQHECHFILSSDGYRAHLTRPVWRAFNRARIMYFLIPAKMTWALQPCDTHVFAPLKDCLRHECQMLTLSSPDGRLTMTLLIRALAQSIAKILRGVSWRGAFWDLGLTGVQATLSDRCLEKLGMRNRPRIGGGLPSLEQLQSVFPARAVLPIDDIFGWFTHVPPAAVQAPAPRAGIAPVPADVDPDRPWLGRLRSSSSLAPAASLPEPQSSAWPLPATSSAETPPLSAAASRAAPRGRRLLPWLPRPRPPLTGPPPP